MMTLQLSDPCIPGGSGSHLCNCGYYAVPAILIVGISPLGATKGRSTKEELSQGAVYPVGCVKDRRLLVREIRFA
jgi:hypothetical protein